VIAEEYPVAEAVIVVVPKFTPVACGWTAGCVCPAGITIFAGAIVTFDVSALESATVTPPVGAADDNRIANGTDFVRSTDTGPGPITAAPP
jgi:hypothetical protein